MDALLAVNFTDRHRRARLIFESSEALADAPVDRRAHALTRLDLYRQAARWVLASEHSPEVFIPGGMSEHTGALLQSSIEIDNTLDDGVLATAVEHLREAVRGMLDAADAPEKAIEARDHWKIVRRAFGLILALVFIPVGFLGATKVVNPVDLAKGKPWRASSKYVDCHPESIDCGGVRTRIFFHTLEEMNPWVEIDLQKPTKFSGVSVHNRTDAVQDRAVPLILEVGDDQKTWRQLARQDDQFKVWKAKFEPTTARYVRLRAPRVTLLHLDAVKVLP